MGPFTPLNHALYQYTLDHSSPLDPVLHELRKITEELPQGKMLSPDNQLLFLQQMIQIIQPQRMIEVGVFTGLSTLAMAQVMPQSTQFIACDKKEQWVEIGRPFWERAGVGHRIDCRIAPALETLQSLIDEGLAHSFNFIFIDANKGDYIQYYEQALQLLTPNGTLLVDNTFWHGCVAEPEDEHNITRKVRRFNQHVHHDPRTTCVMLPIGDGLSLIRKKNPTPI